MYKVLQRQGGEKIFVTMCVIYGWTLGRAPWMSADLIVDVVRMQPFVIVAISCCPEATLILCVCEDTIWYTSAKSSEDPSICRRGSLKACDDVKPFDSIHVAQFAGFAVAERSAACER